MDNRRQKWITRRGISRMWKKKLSGGRHASEFEARRYTHP